MTRRDRAVARMAVTVFESLQQASGRDASPFDIRQSVLKVMEAIPDICPMVRIEEHEAEIASTINRPSPFASQGNGTR